LHSRPLLRCALVAVALFAVAWLALSLRASRLEEEGREVVERAEQGSVSKAEVSAGLDALRRARRFNVDSDARIAEAALLAGAGRGKQAIAVGERVVADEPENLEAWVLVYLSAAFASDEDRAASALRRLDALNPQLADRLRAEAQEGS
jgi:hypothetical protein